MQQAGRLKGLVQPGMQERDSPAVRKALPEEPGSGAGPERPEQAEVGAVAGKIITVSPERKRSSRRLHIGPADVPLRLSSNNTLIPLDIEPPFPTGRSQGPGPTQALGPHPSF